MPYLFCRAELGEDPNDKKEVKEELSKSRKQVEQSRLRLTKLKQDGNELVTNIRVAGDSREAARRAEDDDAKRQRYTTGHIDEAIFREVMKYIGFINFITDNTTVLLQAFSS